MREEIEEALLEAQDELKRVDHIIYVSLKYTRTVDVIRNAINRLIATFDNLLMALLYHKGIERLPKSPRLQANKVRELYEDDERIQFFLDLYIHFRDLMTAPFDRKEEFRRGVTMISHLDNRTAFITIDYLEDNADGLGKEFYKHVKTLLSEE